MNIHLYLHSWFAAILKFHLLESKHLLNIWNNKTFTTCKQLCFTWKYCTVHKLHIDIFDRIHNDYLWNMHNDHGTPLNMSKITII